MRYWNIYGLYVHPNAEGVMISLEEDIEEDVEVVVTNEYLRDLRRHERMIIDERLQLISEEDLVNEYEVDYSDEEDEDEGSTNYDSGYDTED